MKRMHTAYRSPFTRGRTRVLQTAVGLISIIYASATSALYISDWSTVVNNNELIPSTDPLLDGTKHFNSYNQPSIDSTRTVAFRARSTGGRDGRLSGIYTRSMSESGAPIVVVADNQLVVPDEATDPDPTFNEFPSFPRVDGGVAVTRGMSEPIVPDGDGNAGLYVGDRAATLATGVNRSTPVPNVNPADYSDDPGAKVVFEQFPGSASISDNKLVFKGNWAVTDSTGDIEYASGTGVYFTPLSAGFGTEPTRLADTQTGIPNRLGGVKFGSTAPPSAAKGSAMFIGSDNEAQPTHGGIFQAPLVDSPTLTERVSIGDSAPGSAPFTKFSESLSYTGQYVAFHGYTGDDYPYLSDDKLSIVGDINADQGVYLLDLENDVLLTVADNSLDAMFESFVFVNEIRGGHNAGQQRFSPFLAVDDSGNVVFKAVESETPGQDQPVVGLWVYSLIEQSLTKILDTNTLASLLEPGAPEGALIDEFGVERNGFNSGWLAINATVSDERNGSGDYAMSGIYLARVSEPAILVLLSLALAGLTARWRAGKQRG